MNLTIDIGNTRIKCALFENDAMQDAFIYDSLEDLNQLPKAFTNIPTAVCSVRNSPNEIKAQVPFLKDALFLSAELVLPFELAYKTPHTLGMDRLAAAIGGYGLFPNQPLLIIDAGTCITYDLVAEKQFKGGMIAPGIDLRYKSMNDYTANLPLLHDREANAFIGKSTSESMQSGVLNGIKGEIEHHISQLMLKYPDLKVIMTGGDAQLFESKINSDIFVALEIVQLGLNRVLKDNV